MSVHLAQPGVLGQIHGYGRSLNFRLAPGADAKRGLGRFADGFDLEWGAVGLGEPVVRAVGAEIPGLRTFPAFSGPGAVVPSTQQSIWVFLRAPDRTALFDRSEAVKKLLGDAFPLSDAVDTFTYGEGRDLTGFIDGTENPEGDHSVAVALCPSGHGRIGSSFVAVQRWVHDLKHFHGHSQADKDAMIGRRQDTNEEIEDAPISAHVKRAAQEDYEPAAFMVRRSMPWSNGMEQGLEFIAYGASLDAFEAVLRRMTGLDDGTVDALFRFSRPISGSYFWCPPAKGNRLDLSALDL